MSKINIGVLRGGKSDMYEASLKTGANIIKNLSKEKYNTTDVFISDENIWHINGVEVTLFDSVLRFDLIFNALHGKYGSEGNIQHHLEVSGVRFTGPGSFSAIWAKNRIFMKGNLVKHDIRTPGYVVFESMDDVVPESVKIITDRFPLPVIVKPNSGSRLVCLSTISAAVVSCSLRACAPSTAAPYSSPLACACRARSIIDATF
jgi:D-alanine-D-alanine ligase